MIKCNHCGDITTASRNVGWECEDDFCPGNYEFTPDVKEQWRDIPGWEDYYQVSNMGRIKSLERWVDHGAFKQRVAERIIRGSLSPEGYCFVKFSRNGIVESFPSVSKTVYKVWVGPIEEEEVYDNSVTGWTIDHINGEKLDNRSCNLRLLTREENVNVFFRNKGSRGVNFSRGKWLARTTITETGKEKYLGSFDTKEEAQKCYNDHYISIKGKMW